VRTWIYFNYFGSSKEKEKILGIVGLHRAFLREDIDNIG